MFHRLPLPPPFFSSQLQVYRPLVERADSIDRRRIEAEEGLRAADAELDRERDASAAARRDAAELRLVLDQRGARLAEAEAEVRGFGRRARGGVDLG